MRLLLSACLCLAAIAAGSATQVSAQARQTMSGTQTEENRAFIREAFDRWAAGQGDVFSLLADDVVWHITGSDPAVATTYRSRQALLDATSLPLRARLSGPLQPTVKRIWADGDDVLVHWDGAAPVQDGSRYRNTYLWILTLRDRRIVAVTAFLDNAAFKSVLERPAP